MTTIKKKENGEYEVLCPNGGNIGFFVKDDVGIYSWEPPYGMTYWDEGSLYIIADLLKELNKGHD